MKHFKLEALLYIEVFYVSYLTPIRPDLISCIVQSMKATNNKVYYTGTSCRSITLN